MFASALAEAARGSHKIRGDDLRLLPVNSSPAPSGTSKPFTAFFISSTGCHMGTCPPPPPPATLSRPVLPSVPFSASVAMPTKLCNALQLRTKVNGFTGIARVRNTPCPLPQCAGKVDPLRWARLPVILVILLCPRPGGAR